MLDINNIINVSVSAPPSALGPYSINNLVCFTKDTPVGSPDAIAYYMSYTAVATDWGSSSNVAQAAEKVFSQSPNILTGGGVFVVVQVGAEETLTAAITRVKDSVYFGGCAHTWSNDDTEITNAASNCQTLRRMLFVVTYDSSDVDDGLLYDLQDASYTQTRGLFYSSSADAADFKWAYASRGMSTNFSGVNTTQTQNLKQLAGISADDGLTQTILTNAQAVGADVYGSIAGQSAILSYGANNFFDDVYNLNWFVGAVEVAGFNMLRTTSTKLPQTEAGMNQLKDAYRRVCEQALSNRFIAPGEWTSPDTFGDPEAFKRNIRERGYYIYSSPVASQSAADRADRKAPLVQIAIKYAGAIHTSSVIIYVNQ